MQHDTGRYTWRSRILEELYEHPDITELEWVEDLPDDDLELLCSTLDDPEALSELLEELETHVDRDL